MTTKSFVKSFVKPDTSFYPKLMWFWNDAIDKAEIEFQIKEFKKAEIYEFFVHPVSGMEVDYLSDEFFDLIKFTVQCAKENGMKFWIYDEFNWPSGNAGGLLLREHPEARGVDLIAKSHLLYAGQPLDMDIDGEFVSAVAIHKNKTDKVEDITDRVTVTKVNDHYHVYCDMKTCLNINVIVSYTMPSFGICMTDMWGKHCDFGGGMLDANNPEATRAYIDVTYEKYKEAIGDEFGKTVLGSFNDESGGHCFFDNIEYTTTGFYPTSVWPWCKNLPEIFKKEHGYDLIPYVYAISCDFIDGTVLKVRHDYWETFSHLFADNYVKQLRLWCAENKIDFIGHLSGEESAMWHVYGMGDSYLALSEFETPGIDNLFSTQHVDEYSFTLMAKLAVTAAKLNKRAKVLCETFSGSGWDAKMQEIKRTFQRLITVGVNLPQYMGGFYSINESRRRYPLGYAPSHNYNNPLFKFYPEINYEMARLDAASVASVVDAKVFVVIPLRSVQIDKSLVSNIDMAWHYSCYSMMYNRIEHDLASERALENAKIKGNKIVINGFEYEHLVIAGMYYTSDKMANLLKKFIKANGKVLFVNNIKVTASDTNKIYDFSEYLDNANVNFIDLDEKKVKGPEASLYVESTDNDHMDVATVAAKFKPIFADVEPLQITTDSERIFYSHRKNGKDDLFFINNDNANHVNLDCALNNAKNVYAMNPVDGKIYKIKNKINGNAQTFSFLAPAYSVTVILATESEIKALNMPENKATDFDFVLTLEDNWSFKTAEDNWAILRTKMAPASKELVKIKDSFELAEKAVKDMANADNVAVFEIPGGFGIGSDDDYIACGTFTIKNMPSRLKLMIETDEHSQVLINGHDVTSELKRVRYWGIREKEVDILKYVHKGENALVFKARVPSWLGPHSQPASHLRGDFKLEGISTLVKTSTKIKPEIWTNQGFKNYSGVATYSTSFELDKAPATAVLKVPTTDVVKVIVNGKNLGTYMANPYEVDIASALKEGKNTLKLEFTSCFKSVMQAENYDLYYQGYLKYLGEAENVESGLISSPTIKIKK